MTLYETEVKDALGEWASDRYALSEGYPIPQWRRGIKWGIFDETPEEETPHPLQECRWIEKLDSGNYLASDKGGDEVAILTPDYVKEWSFTDVSFPIVAEYYPSLDSVLISDRGNQRIIQVDKGTKSIEHELTSTDLGDLGGAVGAQFGLAAVYDSDVNHLYVCDGENHVVEEVSWDGTVHNSFGEYGVSGSDATHLDNPVFISENRRVTDFGNDRILKLDDTFSVTAQFVAPACTYDRKFAAADLVGSFLSPFAREGGRVWWWPWMDRAVFLNPTEEWTVLYRLHGQVIEQDLRAIPKLPSKERSRPLYKRVMDSVSLDANESSDYHPFFTFKHGNITVKALTTEDATLELFTLEGSGVQADNLPVTWHDYDTLSLTADEPGHYHVNAGAEVMAARITMGATAGSASLWIDRR